MGKPDRLETKRKQLSYVRP